MYVHNLNPALFQIGPFEVRYYGIVYVIGFLLVYCFLKYNMKKGKLNMSEAQLDNMMCGMILAVIIGSRLFHVLFWEPAYYFSNPFEILKLWKGGMSFHGGLVFALFAGWWFSRRYNLNLAVLADIVIIPAVFALALGRIANFINGELVGTVTNLKWCVKFPGYDDCRHPSQIYEAIKRFAVLSVLLFLNRKKHKPGFLFWVFFTLFGAGRFIVNFWRDDPRLFGLSFGQYLGIVMFVAGFVVLMKYYVENKEVQTMPCGACGKKKTAAKKTKAKKK